MIDIQKLKVNQEQKISYGKKKIPIRNDKIIRNLNTGSLEYLVRIENIEMD